MSLLTTVRSAARHRGKSTAQLREELDQANDERDKTNASLDELGNAYLTVVEQLDQAGIDLSGALEDLRVAHEHSTQLRLANEQLAEENRELTTRVANLDPFNIPIIGERDVTPGDSPTEPIDVRALRAAHANDYLNTTSAAWRGPITVIPLWQAPFATGPGAVPPPATAQAAMSLQFAAGARRVTVSGDHRRTA